MIQRLILLTGFVLLIFGIGFQVAGTKNPNEPALRSRSDIYKNRNIISCSPDWSQLNMDSLGKSFPVLPGWGNHHWDIHSTSDSAAFYFDQGINMYYGFHLIESMASFTKALSFDPENPMIHWGKALAYGPNINDVEYSAAPEALKSASEAKRFVNRTDSVGMALIGAMEKRYTKDAGAKRATLNQDYANAMKKVYTRYGHLPDISTLYADALMLLHPWEYWKHNGQPQPWTPEIVQVLEKTLLTAPNHPGANHYYIHMLEASPEPGKALPSANLLSGLMPGVSHMVHMPSHIFIRTGYYQKGISLNTQAVDAYQEYQKLYPDVSANAALYSIHNLHMKAACAMMLSGHAFSQTTAEELQSGIDSNFLSLPAPYGNYAQYLYMTSIMVHVKFSQWNAVMNFKVPEKKYVFSSAIYAWAKGMALAESKESKYEAVKQLTEVRRLMKHPDMMVAMYPFNKPAEQMKVGEWILAGTIAEKESKDKEAMQAFQKAITAEDALVYNEPKDWLLPARYYLAEFYYRKKNFSAAEKYARDDLRINPKHYHSLKLLMDIYSATERYKEMEEIGLQLKESAL